jgi:AraC family transcriptional regulator
MTEIEDCYLVQKDGGVPTTVLSGSAPGEGGVSVRRMRFDGGAYLRATPQQHLIWFQMSPNVSFDCRIGRDELRHEPPAGSLAICPAGVKTVAEGKGSLDTLLVAIDCSQLALAAAEESVLEAQLVGRLTGYDGNLLHLARMLEAESAGDYPNGSLFWHEVASGFLDHLISGHTKEIERKARGMLGKEVLERIRDYVMENLDQPIEVSALASLAGRSPFHFTRVFARSVGISPYRYVVRLRLQRAIELVRDGQTGFADIAAHTGFADQSHLSRWVRRVYGASLTEIAN